MQIKPQTCWFCISFSSIRTLVWGLLNTAENHMSNEQALHNKTDLFTFFITQSSCYMKNPHLSSTGNLPTTSTIICLCIFSCHTQRRVSRKTNSPETKTCFHLNATASKYLQGQNIPVWNVFFPGNVMKLGNDSCRTNRWMVGRWWSLNSRQGERSPNWCDVMLCTWIALQRFSSLTDQSKGLGTLAQLFKYVI